MAVHRRGRPPSADFPGHCSVVCTASLRSPDPQPCVPERRRPQQRRRRRGFEQSAESPSTSQDYSFSHKSPAIYSPECTVISV
ncbi:hypothetical protein ACP70R_001801 [Stipagrostis hirtigluma subsp. patula]